MTESNELSLIEQAQQAAARLEYANKVKEDLLKRQEALEVRRVLGGMSEGGQPKQPEITQEEKDKADMKAYFKGTAIERAFK